MNLRWVSLLKKKNCPTKIFIHSSDFSKNYLREWNEAFLAHWSGYLLKIILFLSLLWALLLKFTLLLGLQTRNDCVI